MELLGSIFPHLNASLNLAATLLLIAGFVQIKRRWETAHRWTMLTAFAVSTLFLGCYLYYHIVVKGGESTRFPSYPPTAVRYFYYGVLLSHILLAVSVPFLAIASIYLGIKNRRAGHRKLAKWTYPIWLYVSITGVVVYVMLYQVYPPTAFRPKIPGSNEAPVLAHASHYQ